MLNEKPKQDWTLWTEETEKLNTYEETNLKKLSQKALTDIFLCPKPRPLTIIPSYIYYHSPFRFNMSKPS